MTDTPEPTHVRVKELFAELQAFVRDNPGAIVTRVDSEKHRFLGWNVTVGRQNRLFTVRVGDVCNLAVSDIDPHSIWSLLLKKREGRERLVEALNEGEKIDFGDWKTSFWQRRALLKGEA